MHAGLPARSLTDWRNRVGGRVPFDAGAAEAAVRGAYRAGGLPAPSQILVARGPREAAQIFAFLENSPRRQRRTAVVELLLGAAAWIFLSLAIDSGAFGAQTLATTAMLSAAFAGFGTALGAAPRLPVPPGRPVSRQGNKVVPLGVVLFAVLAAHAFALQRLGGLPVEPVGRSAGLALAAAVGMLPSVFLHLRMRCAYAHLPRSLLELAPSPSVARPLLRAFRKAWAPIRGPMAGLQPDRSLLQAHRSAHWQAFDEQQTDRLSSNMAAGMVWRLPAEAFGGIPAHLDGIEMASQAAAVNSAGAGGAAALFAELAFHLDRLYPYASIAVAVQPATTVMLDAEGRPHAEGGPALAWADGTSVYAWHGRLVPFDVIAPSVPVTHARIYRELDPGRRAVLIERYGLGRYLLEAGGREIQRDACGRLYRLPQTLGEPILAVRVVNHTPEPDGSVREFWLRVPPATTTAREAVAWTFGLSAEAYDPLVES